MGSDANGLLFALQTSSHDFLQPGLPLYTDAVAYLKNILDPLASDVSLEQQQRLAEARKKRKRGQHEDEEVLRLKQVHVDGFDVEQVWEQARRVIDAARDEAEREYANLQSQSTSEEAPAPNGHAGKKVTFAEDGTEEDDPDEEDLGEEGVDYEVEGVADADELYDEEDADMNPDEAEGDDEDMHDDFDEMDEESASEDEPAAEFVSDKFGLNDGFFSIDDFNKRSEFMEQQDARGDDNGAASDEEDVDWDTDPRTQGPAEDQGVDEEKSEDDEDGPTFGDPDALSEDDEEMEAGDLDDAGGMGDMEGSMYADFFAPPAQKQRRNKKGRPNPHNFPPATSEDKATQDDDMERTMAAVHRDLFEDEQSEQDEEEEEKEKAKLDPSDPRSRKSTHERRQAAIAEEIRKLEAANVAKREWTLSGEARAADRPMNSLLEEDLEFERAGKPVPVITAEVSENIEELIKRRILAQEFQDIVRRRPDDLATGKAGRRGRLDFELDDTKSKKGLAEEYEEEHLKRTDANYVNVKDEKLAKEQKEIESLWKEVCCQLDSLSSWHFKPKQAAPQLDIRVDAPAISMEDARPSAGGEVAGASQLAPQEVYKAGEGTKGVREEVVGKSGLPAGREELTRDEKTRRRRREKERIRKAGTSDTSKGESKGAKKKQEMLGDLKRGGVKVIGKKGEVKDVEGRNVVQSGSGQGAARYKL